MMSASLPTSESVALMTIPARAAWPYLWLYCDDFGRGLDNLSLLKAALWPLDTKIREKHVDAQLDEMVRQQLVCRYIADDGRRCLHVPKWATHQKVSHPQESNILGCPVHEPDLNEMGILDDRLARLSRTSRESFFGSVVESSEAKSSSGELTEADREALANLPSLAARVGAA